MKKKVVARRDYVFIDPKIGLGQMAKDLGVPEDEIQEYQEAMVRMGILKKFEKDGQTVYAIGYWSPMPNGGFRAVPFLNEKDHKKAIREFCLKESL